MEPASITKVMTSYVVAAEMKNGKIKPDDLVTMSERAWRERRRRHRRQLQRFRVELAAAS